jgi:hypothetical protein
MSQNDSNLDQYTPQMFMAQILSSSFVNLLGLVVGHPIDTIKVGLFQLKLWI